MQVSIEKVVLLTQNERNNNSHMVSLQHGSNYSNNV